MQPSSLVFHAPPLSIDSDILSQTEHNFKKFAGNCLSVAAADFAPYVDGGQAVLAEDKVR